MAIRHGSIGAYTNHHCTCADCRKAWSVYCLLNRAKRRARGLCIQCWTPSPTHSRCDHHRLLNAMRQAVRVAALKKDKAMTQTTIALLLVVALLSVACGDFPNIAGPTPPAGTNCTLAGCAADQAPVEILD